jgi:acyl-CoA thioester hydrolase
VQWGETDAAGIVFYPNYFRWFDQASHDLLGHLGYPVSRMIEQGYAVPIIEARGRFLASLAYDDDLLITTRVAEVRTRAFRLDHTVTRSSEVVCEGYEVRIWVRLGQERLEPERIPDELRALLTSPTT